MNGGSKSENLARKAQLADFRQKLAAPVGAVLSYAEMLEEKTSALANEAVRADFRRISTAARDLLALVNGLLDPDTNEALFTQTNERTVQQKLRHDLRTPLNAIIGYSEMLLEEMSENGVERFASDLSAMRAEAGNLLSSIEGIVDFSNTSQLQQEHVTDQRMFTDLVASLRPVERPTKRIKGRILVVDDLESNREVLSRRLVSHGHAVESVDSGEKALERLRERKFDLVLLDLMMPGLNGFEVLTRIKSDDDLRGISVILVSALDELDSVARCIEAGAEDYLPKPFNSVLLDARINACLERANWREKERRMLETLATEKEKFEQLLLNILPRQIVARLNSGETIIADRYDDVSVLFSDLVGFTRISYELPPTQLVSHLNALFSEFDALAREFKVEKIKMIGDAYMAASGVPDRRQEHAAAIAELAIKMIEAVERLNQRHEIPFQIRIGIASGPVVAGIIGTHRFVYDIWGDTVNLASRLEASGLPNRVQISEATRNLLGERFEIELRQKITVKGMGRIQTYFLNAVN